MSEPSVDAQSVTADPVILAGYMSAQLFAAELGCSMRTVWRMRGQGLPYVRMPSGIYIPVEEARAWISARTVRVGRRRKAKAA